MATTINTTIPKAAGSEDEETEGGPRIPSLADDALGSRQAAQPEYAEPSPARPAAPVAPSMPEQQALAPDLGGLTSTGMEQPEASSAPYGGQLSIPQPPVRVAQARPPAGVMSDVIEPPPGIQLEPPPAAPERLPASVK